MAQKKRLSKRVSTKTRETRRKNQTKRNREERRQEVKRLKRIDNLPKSLVKTKEELETLRDIKKRAELRQKEFEENQKNKTETETQNAKEDASRKFMKEIYKMIEEVDVVLEVLDARDPIGSRSKELEKLVQDKRKKLVFVLNKTDLVDRENWTGWLSYLRKIGPSVPFKASTQTQRSNIGHNSKSEQTKEAFGVSEIIHILKNYTRGGVSITVGVIGCPNVGKSSVINSLKRERSCAVEDKPGVTRALQKISLDKSIRLVDTPGVIYKKGNPISNALRLSSTEIEIEPVISLIYRTVPKTTLSLFYAIEEPRDEDEFLTLLALKWGKFTKGCVPDRRTASFMVLRDLQLGKIKFCTPVPDSRIEEAEIGDFEKDTDAKLTIIVPKKRVALKENEEAEYTGEYESVPE